ncbi:MAG: hypothetical protein OXU66_02945 [Gammaproteobacteria bacterium]|nr:hypothetical protein [Gammaproteobacteria bacterium]MDD9894743.1 hypothetical protein [Gammaproteobacteria bacterium]MDD9957873.1 hypothetical protein [Gammaproteobacteria bacterium]
MNNSLPPDPGIAAGALFQPMAGESVFAESLYTLKLRSLDPGAIKESGLIYPVLLNCERVEPRINSLGMIYCDSIPCGVSAYACAIGSGLRGLLRED